MLALIAIILVILWATGNLALHITNGLIHLLLFIAVVFVVIYLYQLVTKQR